jgi:hypothetical protein
MRAMRLAVWAAGLSVAAGAASAAQYGYVGHVAQGTSSTFVFTNVPAAFELDVIQDLTLLFLFPGYTETDPLNITGGLTSPGYATTNVLFGSYDAFFVALNNQTLTVRVENRTKNIDGCIPGSGFLCGITYAPATVYVSSPYEGVGGPTVTTEAVPEPAAWALMIAGFGMAGAALRRRRLTLAA